MRNPVGIKIFPFQKNNLFSKYFFFSSVRAKPKDPVEMEFTAFEQELNDIKNLLENWDRQLGVVIVSFQILIYNSPSLLIVCFNFLERCNGNQIQKRNFGEKIDRCKTC